MDTRTLTKAMMLLLLCVLGQAQAQDGDNPTAVNSSLPITNSNSASLYYKPPSLAQQQAMFEAEQRMMRLEWRNWTGQSPLRPTMNASYLSYGFQSYYAPQRGILVNTGHRSWYW